MGQIAAHDPSFMQIAGDLYWQALDVPMAEQLAERYRKALPPNLQDQKGAKLPPEVQNQMQQMQEQIKQMGDALVNAKSEVDKLEADSDTKDKEILVKIYSAETDRIKALSAGMTPEQVNALVMDSIRDAMTMPSLSQVAQEEVDEDQQEDFQENKEQEPQIEQPNMIEEQQLPAQMQ